MRLKGIALFLILLIMSACQMQNQTPKAEMAEKESMLETIKKRGVLKVGMSTFVPWAMKDKEGNFIGFEIDVAKKLAEDLGVKVEFVPTKWSGIIPALQTGKFDVIIGGMGIRPERNFKVNFTIPYAYSGMSMVAHKEMAKGFSSLDDFNKEDVIIAARIGTTAADAAKKFMPNAELRLFDDESQAVQELMSDRVHAMVASAPLPQYTAVDHPDKLFVPLEENFTKEPSGFAVRKGDYDFINFLNSWIIVADSQGWLKEKWDYWFTTKEWESMVK